MNNIQVYYSLFYLLSLLPSSLLTSFLASSGICGIMLYEFKYYLIKILGLARRVKDIPPQGLRVYTASTTADGDIRTSPALMP